MFNRIHLILTNVIWTMTLRDGMTRVRMRAVQGDMSKGKEDAMVSPIASSEKESFLRELLVAG